MVRFVESRRFDHKLLWDLDRSGKMHQGGIPADEKVAGPEQRGCLPEVRGLYNKNVAVRGADQNLFVSLFFFRTSEKQDCHLRMVLIHALNQTQIMIQRPAAERQILRSAGTDVNAKSLSRAQVPLAEMFGFSTILRSATQGKAQFTMEFAIYRQVPQSIAEKIALEAAQNKKSAA